MKFTMGGRVFSRLETFFFSPDFALFSLVPLIREVWFRWEREDRTNGLFLQCSVMTVFCALLDLPCIPIRIVATALRVLYGSFTRKDPGYFSPLSHPVYKILANRLVSQDEEQRKRQLAFLQKIFRERAYCVFFFGRKLLGLRRAYSAAAEALFFPDALWRSHGFLSALPQATENLDTELP
ncbi:MAG: hypothetical protein AAGF04_05005 [Chlamydiota bacterium]